MTVRELYEITIILTIINHYFNAERYFQHFGAAQERHVDLIIQNLLTHALPLIISHLLFILHSNTHLNWSLHIIIRLINIENT